MRNLAFDCLKGVLIVLVMAGHVSLGKIDENWFRETIYFFHMPLFLAVTGYFLSPATLSLPIREIIKKYTHRLLIPYGCAFIFYSALKWTQSVWSGMGPVNVLVELTIYPFYHLWYVPAVLIFVFALKGMRGLNSIGCAVILSAACVAAVALPFMTEGGGYSWLYYLGDKRFYGYLLYFWLGFYLRRVTGFSSKSVMLMATLFLASVVGYLSSEQKLIRSIMQVVANVAIIPLVIFWCKKAILQDGRFIARLGQVSLPIYLWHVLPLLVLSQLFPVGGLGYYALSTASCLLIAVIFVRLEGKSKRVDALFYGTHTKV